MGELIYLVDDEKNIRELIKAFLLQAGFQAAVFSDAEEFLAAWQKQKPDLAVVDIMMPGMDGLELCRMLKAEDAGIPIIIVSAKDSPYDRVVGFGAGTDDYLVKPFLPLELMYRIKMLLKRKEGESQRAEENEDCCSFGSLCLYPERHEATLRGEALPLTPSEYDFLHYMLQHKERAVKRDELLRHVWCTEYQLDTRATDDLVKRLRRKLRERQADVRIETVWGYGFRLALEKEKEKA